MLCTTAPVNALIGSAVALISIGAAVRMARAQGVPALPVLGLCLAVAAVAAAMAVLGGILLRWYGTGKAGLALYFGDLVLTLGGCIWMAQAFWRSLKNRRRPPPSGGG